MRRRGYEEASKSPQKELTNIEEKVKKSHIFSNVRPYVRSCVRACVRPCVRPLLFFAQKKALCNRDFSQKRRHFWMSGGMIDFESGVCIWWGGMRLRQGDRAPFRPQPVQASGSAVLILQDQQAEDPEYRGGDEHKEDEQDLHGGALSLFFIDGSRQNLTHGFRERESKAHATLNTQGRI